jgi:hypothetical protein
MKENEEKGKIFVEIIDLKTMKIFKKYFKSEFERDKYIRKSKYFKNIKVLRRKDEGLYD